MNSNQFYSLKGSMTFAYEGDRNRDDIVAFAKRLLGKFAVVYMVERLHFIYLNSGSLFYLQCL